MYLWSLFTHGKVFQSLLWPDTPSPATPSVQEPKKPSLPLQSCSPSRVHLFCSSNLWLADRVMLPGLKHLRHRGTKCSGHHAEPEPRTALCPRCPHMKKLTYVDAPGYLRWGAKVRASATHCLWPRMKRDPDRCSHNGNCIPTMAAAHT